MKTHLIFTLCKHIYLEQHLPLVLLNPRRFADDNADYFNLSVIAGTAIKGNFYVDDAPPSEND